MPAETQPRVYSQDLTYLGSFTTPTVDGAGGTFPQSSLTYGGVAGLGPAGDTLYYGLHDQSNSTAEISIPALGGVASIVTTGRYCPMNPEFDDPPSAAVVGTVIPYNGRILISGYLLYDNSPTSPYGWYSFDSAFTQASRQGPFEISYGGGMCGQYAGPIPPEWQSLLGGPWATGSSSLSIITRSSRGPVFCVFDPDDIGPVSCPVTRLLHYQPPATLNTTWPGYVEADQYGGFAFPVGSRSVLYVRRTGDVHCYGDGGPAPTECVDPTDSSKGNHAYPYRHEILAYDANDLLAVKNGTMVATDVLPYTKWQLTPMELVHGGVGWAQIKSSVYNPTTRRWYMTAFSGSGTPRVHVWQLAAEFSGQPLGYSNAISGGMGLGDGFGWVSI